MSYETEEQQVERLKEWWSENGTPLVIGAVLGLASFGGWKYWNNQEVSYQENASDMYNKVTEILNTENKTGLVESALAVKTNYPESSYAILAAFNLAKHAVDAGELDKAAAEFSWVIDNHADNELTSMAKIRLARVLIEQDKASDALALVDFSDESGYYALANMIKGDALIALERKNEALDAYKIASSDTEVTARHPSLRIKIDELSALDVNVAEAETEAEAQTETETPEDSK